jgi:farnesyl-diphosphate farnesyltransferase
MNNFDDNTTLQQSILFQQQALVAVSRSFALTIPQLPEPIQDAVANCYLWCRITDTIEDDAKLTIGQKQQFHQQLIKILQDQLDHNQFITDLLPKLSIDTPTAEKLLITNLTLVLNITNSLPKTQQALIKQCVINMNQLMPQFEQTASLNGLNTIKDFDNYCYAVAGVVGEMLTGIFSDHCQIPSHQQSHLMKLSKSFGQALQMTNILKDRWTDYARNICWLPKDYFANDNFKQLLKNPNDQLFTNGIKKLVKLNYQHLHNALNYVTMLPNNQIGIRRFCLWAIGIAVATLKNIYNNPNFTNVKQIKISRLKLKFIIFITNRIVKYNWLLKAWFKLILL